MDYGDLRKRRMLDLCAGTGSMSEPWIHAGGEVVRIDMVDRGIEHLTKIDILSKSKTEWSEWVLDNGPFDWVHASPDCKCYSVANGAKFREHWGPYTGDNHVFLPHSPEAQEAQDLVEMCIHIAEVNAKHCFSHGLAWGYWTIENPRALLRKMGFMQRHQRTTVTYCQYGDTRQKPTDLWGRFPRSWQGKACKRGADCHESAPRGSRSGSQGLEYHDRIKIPYELPLSLMKNMIKEDGEAWFTLDDWCVPIEIEGGGFE